MYFRLKKKKLKKNKLKGRISGEIGPRDIFIFMIKSENGNSCRFMSLPYLCNNYCWLVRAELSQWWCLVIIGWIGFITQRDSHFTGEQAEVEWFNQVKRIEKSVFNRFFIAVFSRFWGWWFDLEYRKFFTLLKKIKMKCTIFLHDVQQS